MIDPLRDARRSVSAGQFREALAQLTARRPEPDQPSPEWSLLMAMASWRLGQFEESHAAAVDALAEYRARGDVDGEMRAQNVAAAGAFALGRLAAAQEGFERALHLARQLDDRLMKGRCTNNLGNVAHYRGDNDEALQHYRRAASLFEHIGSVLGVAEAWHNMSIVLREEGDLRGAAHAADRAVEAAERLGEPRMLGQTLSGRGETDAFLGDLPLGTARTARAIALAREHGDRLTEIDSLRILALIARQRGDSNQAVDVARSAVKLASDVKNSMMIAKTQIELGKSLSAMNRSAEAAEAFTEAADVLARMGAEPRARAIREAFLTH